MVLTDDNLRKAAQSVRNTMLTSLPHPTDCEIEFSNEFQTKMEHLRLKANIIAKRQKMVRSIASVLLVLLSLLLFGSQLMPKPGKSCLLGFVKPTKIALSIIF